MPARPAIAFRKIDTLKPDPRNARTHSEAQIEQVAASIRRFGWTNCILADDLIRAGHGRLAAAQLIYAAGERIYMAPGQANGAAAIPQDTVPVIDCTGWSEDERRAFALADNQLALNAGWDEDILAAELNDLVQAGFDMPLIGFDSDALISLLGEAGVKNGSRTAPDDFPEFDEGIETEHVCPKCAYRWSGKAS